MAEKLSANEALKRSYGKYMDIGIAVAVFVHIVAFAVAPEYKPSPYQLRESGKIQAVDVPDEIVVPPPPKEIERPELPQEAEISDDVSEDETIAPTGFDPFEPPVIPQAPKASTVFVAFDSPPEPIRRVEPVYPEQALMAGMEGHVKVEVVIDEIGRVIEARVVKTDATDALNEAARQAALKWLFKPARQRDVPVKCRIVIPFTFKAD